MCGVKETLRKKEVSVPIWGKVKIQMNAAMSKIDERINALAVMLRKHGVPIREADNVLRLGKLKERLPRRLPQSLESLLSRYQASICLESRSLNGMQTSIHISQQPRPKKAVCQSC